MKSAHKNCGIVNIMLWFFVERQTINDRKCGEKKAEYIGRQLDELATRERERVEQL